MVKGEANSPTAVTVTAGANIIKITLANNASGQLFINSATTTEG